jgi:hypothetical protein
LKEAPTTDASKTDANVETAANPAGRAAIFILVCAENLDSAISVHYGDWVGREMKRRRRKPIVILGDGDSCPRCGVPMQIREPDRIDDRQRHQHFFYTRWFCCMNRQCKTTLVMPVRYKVANLVV